MKYQLQSDTGNNGYVSLEQETCVPSYGQYFMLHANMLSRNQYFLHVAHNLDTSIMLHVHTCIIAVLPHVKGLVYV